MTKGEVLLIEDSRDMQILVKTTIEGFSHLDIVPTLAEAQSALEKKIYDLIVLDVVLPDGDGFKFCEKMRSRGSHRKTPLIFLTGAASVQNRVHGFSLGADDYITKPFEPDELAARVQSKLKREWHNRQALATSGLRIDIDGQRAYASVDGQDKVLGLTPIEFKILNNFLNYPGLVLTREQIKDAVWGKEVHISSHTVDAHISSLRKKMGSSRQHLKAVPKKGYSFISETSDSLK